ncbi:MAG: VWA domain-containing protein [Methanobacteriaceae archaeon]|nr:VWA domain-containing protein [Methanobacteriaceae archaeon]
MSIKNEKIIALSNLLRNNGMDVSIRSTKTACNVLKIVPEDNIEILFNSLESVYVKDHEDKLKFKKVFEDLFENYVDIPYKQEEIKKEGENYPESDTELVFNPENIQNLKEIGLIPHLEQKRVIDQKISEYDINDLDFFDQRIFDLCYKLGVKIANRRIKRKKLSKQHEINISKTLRSNLKHGGKLITLIKSKPPKKNHNHIFLSDVSGSCDWITSWFFVILYASKRSFNKMQAYEFDNKIINITDLLKKTTYKNSYEEIRKIRIENRMFHGQSDMYSAFNEFYKQAPINNKSYVIILSDCREWNGLKENNRPLSADILEKIVNKSKKVIILNPESQNLWYNETSAVKYYEEVGAQVYEIGSLNHLANLITKL